MQRPLRSLLLVATAVASFAVPASADWLILRGGKKIETKGAWVEHANNTVSFTETDGHRSSVLMSLIDNAATRQANGGKVPKPAAKGAKTDTAAAGKTVISDDNTKRVDDKKAMSIARSKQEEENIRRERQDAQKKWDRSTKQYKQLAACIDKYPNDDDAIADCMGW